MLAEEELNAPAEVQYQPASYSQDEPSVTEAESPRLASVVSETVASPSNDYVTTRYREEI